MAPGPRNPQLIVRPSGVKNEIAARSRRRRETQASLLETADLAGNARSHSPHNDSRRLTRRLPVALPSFSKSQGAAMRPAGMKEQAMLARDIEETLGRRFGLASAPISVLRQDNASSIALTRLCGIEPLQHGACLFGADWRDRPRPGFSCLVEGRVVSKMADDVARHGRQFTIALGPQTRVARRAPDGVR